jgi:hypothetical protein
MDKITTTLRREPLAQIVAGTKKIEYREIKEYWTEKLAKVKCPFELRLINGMDKKAPEVTVLIKKIRRNSREGVYELHIKKVLFVKNWDKKTGKPT